MLRAISSRQRRKILRLVWKHEKSSSEIASGFDITWSAISQHLGVLRKAGLVRERRDGTFRYYTADRRAAKPIERVLKAMWTEDLSRLKAVIENGQ